MAVLHDSLVPGVSSSPYRWSALVTGLVFFGVGAMQARFVGLGWSMSGIESLAVGRGAAALVHVTGMLLDRRPGG